MPGVSREERLSCDYISAGLVDSVRVVELIVLLEHEFGIRFDSDDFGSEKIRSVGGLIEIVGNKLPA